MDAGELQALHETLFRLERRWLPPLPPDTTVCFGYDPLPLAEFLPGIRAASGQIEGRRFLDIGCGIGTKLALMSSLGWQVAGIDQYEPYLESAAELVPEATLILADAFEVARFDADLVYMYRPMVRENDQLRLERHVMERTSPGTLVFLPGRCPRIRVVA